MDARTAARLLALGRIGMGAALLAAPERITRTWLGADGGTAGASVMGNVIGVRDLALGLGQLRGDARPWVLAGVACDLVDGVVTLRSREHLPAFGVAATAAMAFAGAAAGAWIHSAID